MTEQAYLIFNNDRLVGSIARFVEEGDVREMCRDLTQCLGEMTYTAVPLAAAIAIKSRLYEIVTGDAR